MTRVIEGFCNFQNGDQLKVNGVVKAEVTQVEDTMFLDFKDANSTRMYLGNLKQDSSKQIDGLINVAWTTLGLTW